MGKLTKTEFKATSLKKVDEVLQWLSENYVIKLNTFDKNWIYIEKADGNEREFKSGEITPSDIFLHMQNDGVSCSYAMLRKLLTNRNMMPTYDPIEQYFKSLEGKYKGVSMIDMLVDSLHVRDFGDGVDRRERASYLLRKWIVAVVACYYEEKAHNDVAFGIVSQTAGVGKTTFFENLVPDMLKPYYCVSSDDEKYFKMTDCFASKLIINFDEFVGIRIATHEEFKQNMSRDRLEIFDRIEGCPVIRKRIASACFTTNKTQEMGGFILTTDNGLLRRLALIEVTGIDDYRQDFDVDQLWAEALMMYRGGFDYVWNQQDYAINVTEAMPYAKESNAMRIINMFFRQPEGEEDAEKVQHMSAREIITLLTNKRKLSPSNMKNINEITVGKALNTLGYNRHSKKTSNGLPRYVYDVIRTF